MCNRYCHLNCAHMPNTCRWSWRWQASNLDFPWGWSEAPGQCQQLQGTQHNTALPQISHEVSLINPRHMCRKVVVVILSMCVSVCLLPRWNLLHTSFVRRKQGVIGFFTVFSRFFVVWLLLKMLRSKVLASFADRHCLSRFLMSSRWTEETAIASFQCEECIQLAIASTTQLTHHWSL